ncbi:transglutaminase domain-containing protein [Actinomadura sp. NAK00032]|uniref:transglutaminase domain-containing protein n=1 Tax=Actinomadura sp. NAK00032 TaxID=2742128 RepID=UPI0015901EB4|nr:transglutaminase domain-containing protein [Actinomadura sp. NAK00032]QKW37175.1 transglutaminase domain-containing protein [Actinomadura sp. NAK00032]
MGRATAHPLLRTLDGLLVVPPEHHRPDTGRADAAEMLACPEATLSDLVRHGLPATGERGRERFDSRDIFNIALYSGSGRTGIERTVASALRWTRASCEDLIAPRVSRFELRVACGSPDGCRPGARNTLARPRTGAYGGRVRHVRAHPAGAARNEHAGTAATARASGPALALSAVLRTVGDCPVLRSPALRAILREFMGAELRWLRLPEAMRDDESLVPRGFASCGSASRYIARLCREEGIPATTRIGWVVGLPDLVHAWVEVEDEDGVTKVIDPTFVLLAEVIPGANPMLRDPGIAFRTNRLVPTALGVGADIASHTCAAGHLPRVSTSLVPMA